MPQETVIAGIMDHIEQASQKLEDVFKVHLPEIASFAQTLKANPLVTAFASSIPGELSGDAMAILNGLVPLLGALGGHVAAQQPPAPAGGPAVPATPASPAVPPAGGPSSQAVTDGQ